MRASSFYIEYTLSYSIFSEKIGHLNLINSLFYVMVVLQDIHPVHKAITAASKGLSNKLSKSKSLGFYLL
ncbi:hypothetical protein GCM10008933_48350 [Paenibacillus motobuensis]|uniref:Uncharacterized protein n=1 Tax=Paenibacillus motobuensis TaxID=295324 RepID=A0ABN0YW32_9BACL